MYSVANKDMDYIAFIIHGKRKMHLLFFEFQAPLLEMLKIIYQHKY